MSCKILFIYVSIFVLSFLCLSTGSSYAAFPIVVEQNHSNNQVKLNVNSQVEERYQKIDTIKNPKNERKREKDNGATGIFALLLSLVGYVVISIGTSAATLSLPLVVFGFLFSLFAFILAISGTQRHRKNKFLSLLALIISGYVVATVLAVALILLII